MKKLFYISIALMFIISSCKEYKPQPYSGLDAVCFSTSNLSETKQVTKEFNWAASLDPNAQVDTCWVEVMSVGREVDYDRPIKLIQKEAKGVDYKYDAVGNLVDSLVYIIPDQAEVEVDYKSFEDPSIQSKMVLKAHQFKAMIPIVIIKNNKDLRKKTLLVQMVNDGVTKVAEQRLSTCLITIE